MSADGLEAATAAAPVFGREGVVARSGPLTVILVGVDSPPADPTWAGRLLAALDEHDQLDGPALPAGLTAVVTELDPAGAAILRAEPGRASLHVWGAIDIETTHEVPNGDSEPDPDPDGWSQRPVRGRAVRLGGDAGEHDQGWQLLRSGVVIAGGIVVELETDDQSGAEAPPGPASAPGPAGGSAEIEPPATTGRPADPISTPAEPEVALFAAAPNIEDPVDLDDDDMSRTTVVDPAHIGATRLASPGPPSTPTAPEASPGSHPGPPPPRTDPIPSPPPPGAPPNPGPPPPGTPPTTGPIPNPPPPGVPPIAGPPPGVPPTTGPIPSPPPPAAPPNPGPPPPGGSPNPGPPPPGGSPAPGPPPPAAPPNPGPPPPGGPPNQGPPPPGVPPSTGPIPDPPPPGVPPSTGPIPDPPPPGAGTLPQPAPPGMPLPPLAPPPGGSPNPGPPPPRVGDRPGQPPPGVNPASQPPAPGPSAGGSPPPPQPGAGQPIGFLIAEPEGTVHPITMTTIIGSDPANDPEVVIGAATIITVDDPSVHEVHVRIKVNGRQATVEESGFGSAWIQAGVGPMTALSTEPRPLEPGDQLRLGRFTFMFRAEPGRGS